MTDCPTTPRFRVVRVAVAAVACVVAALMLLSVPCTCDDAVPGGTLAAGAGADRVPVAAEHCDLRTRVVEAVRPGSPTWVPPAGPAGAEQPGHGVADHSPDALRTLPVTTFYALCVLRT